MAYVVVVKPPDDHPGAVRVFGFFRERPRAADFCARIVDAVDRAEAAETDDVDYRAGYAYVMPVRPSRVREAQAWATKGEAV